MNWLTDREKRDRKSGEPKIDKLRLIGGLLFGICLSALLCTLLVMPSLANTIGEEFVQPKTLNTLFLLGIIGGLMLAAHSQVRRSV